MVEVDLTVRVDAETGVRVGVVRGAGAIDGANGCRNAGSVEVKECKSNDRHRHHHRHRRRR